MADDPYLDDISALLNMDSFPESPQSVLTSLPRLQIQSITYPETGIHGMSSLAKDDSIHKRGSLGLIAREQGNGANLASSDWNFRGPDRMSLSNHDFMSLEEDLYKSAADAVPVNFAASSTKTFAEQSWPSLSSRVPRASISSMSLPDLVVTRSKGRL